MYNAKKMAHMCPLEILLNAEMDNLYDQQPPDEALLLQVEEREEVLNIIENVQVSAQVEAACRTELKKFNDQV